MKGNKSKVMSLKGKSMTSFPGKDAKKAITGLHAKPSMVNSATGRGSKPMMKARSKMK